MLWETSKFHSNIYFKFACACFISLDVLNLSSIGKATEMQLVLKHHINNVITSKTTITLINECPQNKKVIKPDQFNKDISQQITNYTVRTQYRMLPCNRNHDY